MDENGRKIQNFFKRKQVLIICSIIIALAGTTVALAMSLHTQKENSKQSSEIQSYVDKIRPVINDMDKAIYSWNDLQDKIKSGKIMSSQISPQLSNIKSMLNDAKNKQQSVLQPKYKDLSNLNNDLKNSLLDLSIGIPNQLNDQTDFEGINTSLNKANKQLENYSTKLKDYLFSHSNTKLYKSQLANLMPIQQVSKFNKPINENEVKNFVLNYQYSLVRAVNEDNFSNLTPLLIQDSKIYSEAKNLIDNLNSQGIQEDITKHDIIGLQLGDKANTYKIKTTATYKINQNSNTEKVIEESDEYTVYDDGKTLGLTDINVLSTKTDSVTNLTQPQVSITNSQVKNTPNNGNSTVGQDQSNQSSQNQDPLVPPTPEGLSSDDYGAKDIIQEVANALNRSLYSLPDFNNLPNAAKDEYANSALPTIAQSFIDSEKSVLDEAKSNNPYLIKYKNIVNNIINKEATNLNNIAAALKNGDINSITSGMKEISDDSGTLFQLDNIMTNNFHLQ